MFPARPMAAPITGRTVFIASPAETSSPPSSRSSTARNLAEISWNLSQLGSRSLRTITKALTRSVSKVSGGGTKSSRSP